MNSPSGYYEQLLLNTTYLSTNGVNSQSISLLDAFQAAKDLTEKRTTGRQMPIFKGSLSSPFVFEAVKPIDLVGRVSSILARSRSDQISMMQPDPGEIYRVRRTLEKARDFDPDNATVLSALASLAIANGSYDVARQLLKQTMVQLKLKSQGGNHETRL